MQNNELTEKQSWQNYANYCHEKIKQTTSAYELLYYQCEVAECEKQISLLSE